MNTSPSNDHTQEELLRYAAELGELRQRERDAQREIVSLRRALAQAQAQQLKTTADLRRSYDGERNQRAQLREAFLATIRAFAVAVEVRDDHTGLHTERVRRRSRAIARRLGLKGEALELVEMSALLHDLGKITIPDHLLTKTDPLTDAEWQTMRRHPETGAAILRTIPFLRPVAGLVESHHERWDGTGYPHGLAGPAIPMGARIIAVADTYDAITTPRTYRQARDAYAAMEEIWRLRGAHFDPEVVDAFLHGSKMAQAS